MRSVRVPPEPASVSAQARPRLGMVPLLLGIGVLALAGTFLWLRLPGLLAIPATPTASHDQMPMVGLPVTAGSDTAVPAGMTVGLLRFQDGAASVDEVTVTALGLPVLPPGQQYEAWLIGQSSESRRSIGQLKVDAEGKGTLSFIDTQGRNLLERFDTLELTIEPDPDSNPNPSENMAFHVTLPGDALMHVRHLLVAFEDTPDHIGLVDGLLNNTTLLDNAARDMLTAQGNGDQAAIRRDAESMLNLLVGSQSEDHKDWDEDGTIMDAGDGFGLLLNGDNEGYIEGAFDHADYAATAPDATQNMIVHGEHVKACAQNMEQWAPQLRDLLKQILTQVPGPDLEASVRRAAALADEMLEGTDLNGNEQVEPIPGEGGARTAYQHAYYMADITLVSP